VLAAVDKLLVLDQGQARAFGPRDQVIAAMNADAGGQRARPAVVQGGRV
jgi:ABC-type protease/lipase transport system fused ATPase/permease subunit